MCEVLLLIVRRATDHIGDALIALAIMQQIHEETGETFVWQGTASTNALMLGINCIQTIDFEQATHWDLDLTGLDYAGWDEYAKAFGMDWNGKSASLVVTDAEMAISKLPDNGKLKIGLCTTSRDKHRCYPHHKALVKQLKKYGDVYVYGRERLPIRQLVPEVSQIDKFISVDTGLAHLAGCSGVPLVIIEGPTDCRKLYDCYANTKYVSTKDNCDRKPCVNQPCKYANCMYLVRPRKICDVLIPNDNKQTKRKIAHHTVALMRLDGLGGTITLSDQAKKVKEAIGAEITLIIRHYPELFDDNPYVDHVITVGRINWDDCLQVYKDKFTALADIRMAVGKWYDPTNIFHQDFANWESYYEQFPINQQDFSIYGLHHIQLTDKILGLPFDTIDSKVFFDLSLPEWFSEKDFICICPGLDEIHSGKLQTKC